MKDWITDYQVATEPWEYDIADRKEWNHLVCTTRSEYPTSVLKKNGEPRKSAKKSMTRNKHKKKSNNLRSMQ